MPASSFLNLPTEERADIVQAASSETVWAPAILEKDAWVVWCLDALFRQNDAPDYAFKGGTSLSKVFNAIDRFSEDVDITVSTQHPLILGDDDPLDSSISKNRRKTLNQRASENLQRFLHHHLVPYLESCAATLSDTNRPTMTIDGESVRVHYPSALPSSYAHHYVDQSVLLEFGTRGTTEPRIQCDVATYLADAVETAGSLHFPSASVMAMRAERTFWEKITLAHAEITRTNIHFKDRAARHWYDLYRLSMDEGLRASSLASQSIYLQVIDIKSKQFPGGGVDYQACRKGQLKLVPKDALLKHLHDDYQSMRQAGMFLNDPPTFDSILGYLTEIEAAVNAMFTPDGSLR